MTTHDKIELPPLPKFDRLSSMHADDVANLLHKYGRECARAAIEADRKRRGEPVKVPSDADAKHIRDFIACDGMGAVIVEGPQYSAVVRALLARYGQTSQPAKSGLSVSYDDKYDVLYVDCNDSNEPIDAEEDDKGILYRRAISDGRLIGITVMNFMGQSRYGKGAP